MTSALTRSTEALTAAQSEMREIQTEAQAHAWTRKHYQNLVECDLESDADAMAKAIAERLGGLC